MINLDDIFQLSAMKYFWLLKCPICGYFCCSGTNKFFNNKFYEMAFVVFRTCLETIHIKAFGCDLLNYFVK